MVGDSPKTILSCWVFLTSHTIMCNFAVTQQKCFGNKAKTNPHTEKNPAKSALQLLLFPTFLPNLGLRYDGMLKILKDLVLISKTTSRYQQYCIVLTVQRQNYGDMTCRKGS